MSRMTAFVRECPPPTDNPLDAFDPNAPEIGLFATYCFRRARGSFKVHARRSHALAALRVRNAGIYYEHDGAKWVEKARINPRGFEGTTCDRCGGSTLRYAKAYNFSTGQYEPQTELPKLNEAVQKFDRDPYGKLVEPVRVVVLCPDCN